MVRPPPYASPISIHGVRFADPAESSGGPPFLAPELLSAILTHHTLDSRTLFSATLASNLWNECATPILYRDIRRRWDSRMTSLVRAKPSLPALIRNVSVYYPRV